MLVPVLHHAWDLAPAQAIALQHTLAARAVLEDRFGVVRAVAGVDVGLRGERARAAVVVCALPGLEVLERVCVERPMSFPYVPGLLSFREAPAILDALAQMRSRPDLLLLDGQGTAHPRRMGIATHLGILLDWPTIGCAKSRLFGSHAEPAPERGSYAWLYAGEEIIGAVLRTRARVKPMYVSAGHRVGLPSAIECVLRCGTGYRLPEPLRQAHRLASRE